jgi:nucleotide-binding universal stress UspA family protein
MAGGLVLGYDDSDGARAALGVALELAAALGEPLHVAFAARPPGRDVGDEYRAHRDALEELGEEVTAEALGRAAEAGVAAEAVIADEKPVDLVAGGHRRRPQRGHSRAAIGAARSAPDDGVRMVSCPSSHRIR